MKAWWYFVIVPVLLIVLLFFVRLVLPSQLDDVSPGIPCSEELLNKVDAYYVIPKFEGVEIGKVWCEEIAGRGKDIRMHGVTHEYKEFGELRSEEYFGEGVDIFETCFGFSPDRFKPGNLAWNDENNWIKNEMEVDIVWNQIFHKVYHCNDTGVFKNWMIRVF